MMNMGDDVVGVQYAKGANKEKERDDCRMVLMVQ
jgi:hypothetical protein